MPVQIGPNRTACPIAPTYCRTVTVAVVLTPAILTAIPPPGVGLIVLRAR